MDSINLCSAIRMEFEGVFENKIPLDVFPVKIQNMILALARQENYSIEYMMASLLVAVSTAIGNAINIRIRGGWVSNSALYMILVGRPGMGKTPPLDFVFRPIRKHDAKAIKQFKLEMEQYNNLVESNKGKKENITPLPDKPVLRRTIISDFTPEALMRALDDNQRGIVVYVDEIMGMFNAVNQYSRGQLIEQLLTAFSGKPLDISRCSMPVPIHIEYPFINIVGTMQTTRMHELVEKGYKENGLLDRIIFVYPSSQEISDWQLDEDSSLATFEKYSTMWETIINKVISLPFAENENDRNAQNILNFSSEAKAYFTNWRNNTIRAVNQIQDDGLVDSRVIKAPMIMARLALILQILRWACGETHKDFVDIDSTKSAIALSEYFENCYADIQKYMLKESIEPQKKEFLDCLSETFTTSDAIQAGKEVGLSERSVMYSLANLATNKIIKKVKRGEYEKLQ
ncbi:YfjI family protein [Bacteroides fragilis]|nr:YfjI family protein [Bacteroides fragilis]MCS2878708.1 YfjI family protein [Bacteroides fragilis]